MDGKLIETVIKSYLVKLARGEVTLPPELVEELSTSVGTALTKEQRDGFTIRMSNVGRAMCQLIMERDGATKDPYQPAQMPVKFALGDMLEAWFIMVMKASGLEVQGVQNAVELEIGGTVISGTSDLVLLNKVWDIKTASDYAYRKYSTNGFQGFVEEDPFGYIGQGMMYSAAHKLPFGGWIIINKSNGEFFVLEAPDDQKAFMKETLREIDAKIKRLNGGEEFSRCFTDEAETFRKKETGNKVLPFNCEWCDYKHACWKDVDYRPAVMSKAVNRKWVNYTVLENIPEDD